MCTTLLYELQLSCESSYSFLNLWSLMAVSDKRHASAALPPVDSEELENSPQYPFHMWSGEPVNSYKCRSERKISASPRIEPLNSGLPSRSLVKLTELARLWKDELAYSIKMDGYEFLRQNI